MNEETSGQILEKIDSIERRLLELEKKSGGDIDPHVAVHLLFRDLHNLKSTLSMQGAEQSAHLVHQAESCLDALRSGKGDIESDWADLLLAVSDHIRTAVETDTESENAPLSQKIKALLEAWAHQESAQTRTIEFPLDVSEASAVKKAVADGRSLFTLEKLIGETLDIADADSLPVFDAVSEAGTLIARRLVRVPGSGSVLTIVFATDKNRDDISFILFDPFYPVSGSSEPEKAPNRRQNHLRKAAHARDEKPRMNHILIVDDEPVALMLMQHFLSPYGRLDSAQNGNDAVEKFSRALEKNDPYQIIFLDILIPGMTGTAVLEEIRKQEQAAGIAPGKGTRIVMASSLGDYASISASFQSQGDAYLVKPIDDQVIEKTMMKLGFIKTYFPFSHVPNAQN